MGKRQSGKQLTQTPHNSAKPQWDAETYALARQIMRRIGYVSAADKEDIIQDVALKNSSLDKFKGRSKFKTWLTSVLNNEAASFARDKNHLRKKPENRPVIEPLEQYLPVHDEDSEEGVRPREIPAVDRSPHDLFLIWKFCYTRFICQCGVQTEHDGKGNILYVMDKPELLFREIISDDELKYIHEHTMNCKFCFAWGKKLESSSAFLAIGTSPPLRARLVKEADETNTNANVLLESDIRAFISRFSVTKRRLSRPFDENTARLEEAMKQDTSTTYQFFGRTYQKPKRGAGSSAGPKGPRRCSLCEEPGHNARTCRKRENYEGPEHRD